MKPHFYRDEIELPPVCCDGVWRESWTVGPLKISLFGIRIPLFVARRIWKELKDAR